MLNYKMERIKKNSNYKPNKNLNPPEPTLQTYGSCYEIEINW